MADVRNSGSGSIYSTILGNVEGDPITPLDNPRGIPDDASPGWVDYVKGWGMDMHSHSYFTLAELDKFREEGKFSETYTERGWISIPQYLELKKGFTPTHWAGGVGGGGVRKIRKDELDTLTEQQLIEIYEETVDKYDTAFMASTYVEAEWEVKGDEMTFGDFLEAMDAVKERLPQWEPEHIRLVFGFDN